MHSVRSLFEQKKPVQNNNIYNKTSSGSINHIIRELQSTISFRVFIKKKINKNEDIWNIGFIKINYHGKRHHATQIDDWKIYGPAL